MRKMRLIVDKLKSNWGFIRIVVAVVVVVFCVFYLIPTDGVHEIHNAHLISNFALVEPRPQGDDWPWWRGTDRRNTAEFEPLTGHMVDSVEQWIPKILKGFGHATPIVWRSQLFLLSADVETERVSLEAYDRSAGRELWKTVLHQGGFQILDDRASHASATPVCDGQYVYTVAVTHGRLQVSSVDFSGKIAWQTSPGSYLSSHGYISSPVLYQSVVIVAADQAKHGYLAALHRQTGEVVWRIKRPDGESFGTPLVAEIAGRPQLILCGTGSISSYVPATGEELWKYCWSSEQAANTMAFDDQHIFATSKHPDPQVVCVKADGLGDITHSHLVWRQTKIGSEVPSPVCHAGLLYVLADDGLLACLDAGTGKIEWRKRLLGNFSASPLIAGNSLICSSESGNIYTVKTGILSEVIAEFSLPDGIVASPIVAGGMLYFRTRRGLHRIGNRVPEPVATEPEAVKRRF